MGPVPDLLPPRARWHTWSLAPITERMPAEKTLCLLRCAPSGIYPLGLPRRSRSNCDRGAGPSLARGALKRKAKKAASDGSDPTKR